MTRPNRAPPEILSRAIAFAVEFQATSLLWIDQECIDQDNRVEKELAIQSMDQVYHRAMVSLGLQTYLSTLS